ncbi:ssDNA-binding protein [Xylella fastidiosa subsp. sandyi]|uniref:ssDNA-binding protein n=1 Tax=Xylella fastidiosa TaxID=2371 RepID=UPI00070812F2|nr:ssDNA-binding protein [Xylella fastidiosa]KQH73627.1 hypothetical protein AOT81_07435 [Xylella fastidiosa]RWA44037.1 DUF2815 domain-containing protein [Xylella fastidiosa subsp. sandyi]WNY20089.1 DUF2815 family protein [Xylella fastidiosa]WNY22383.1 DUF2815 family protein [Xylella fastidiosa]
MNVFRYKSEDGDKFICVHLEKARLAFPVLETPQVFPGEKDKTKKGSYSAYFILEPHDPQINELHRVLAEVALMAWGKDAGTVLQQLRARNCLPLRDGALKAAYDGFAGNVFLATRSYDPPVLIDENNNRVPREETQESKYSDDTLVKNKFYPGCIVDVLFRLNAYEAYEVKRINAILYAVRFIKDAPVYKGKLQKEDMIPIEKVMEFFKGAEDYTTKTIKGLDLENVEKPKVKTLKKHTLKPLKKSITKKVPKDIKNPW